MIDVKDIIVSILIILGCMLLTVSAIGLLKLPDFFSRLHASSIGQTLGVILIASALLINTGINWSSLKIFLIILGVFMANPLCTHLIGRAALLNNLKPEVDEDTGVDVLGKYIESDKEGKL